MSIVTIESRLAHPGSRVLEEGYAPRWATGVRDDERARDRTKATRYAESAIVRRYRRPSAESRANASPPFPRLEEV